MYKKTILVVAALFCSQSLSAMTVDTFTDVVNTNAREDIIAAYDQLQVKSQRKLADQALLIKLNKSIDQLKSEEKAKKQPSRVVQKAQPARAGKKVVQRRKPAANVAPARRVQRPVKRPVSPRRFVQPQPTKRTVPGISPRRSASSVRPTVSRPSVSRPAPSARPRPASRPTASRPAPAPVTRPNTDAAEEQRRALEEEQRKAEAVRLEEERVRQAAEEAARAAAVAPAPVVTPTVVPAPTPIVTPVPSTPAPAPTIEPINPAAAAKAARAERHRALQKLMEDENRRTATS